MHRIVIVGGGFGGVKCAQALRRNVRPGEAEIVLFNRENHLVFSPLLADAVGSSINLQDVVVPLRQLLPGVLCRTEQVLHVNLETNEVEFEGHDGATRRLGFDHVVLACGNVSNLNVVPGMGDHAFPLKTVGDAAVLRTHVLQQLEKAEVCDDAERRRWYLSFIVVGGGYSGVESAGEINDLVRGSVRFFHHIRAEDISVTLIHSRDQLLPEISPALREFARHKMERAGVKMLLNARVQLATGEGVGLADGTFVRGGTIVCTIGTTTAPVIKRLQAPKENGRVLTEPDLRIRGLTNAWAVGDCASIINALDGKASPPTGQFAEREGSQCALNIVRTIRGQPTRPFSFKVLGQLCSIGGHRAVAELFGFRLSGFLAWFAWRGIYLFKLPSWSRRVQVGFDWAWLLVFPRDLAHIRTDVTDRVTHAFFQPGDWIIKQGDPPTSFFVIEKGEVEVIRSSPAHPGGETIASLREGDFFGEQALIDNRPRSASIRARTPLEAVVMGRHVFTTISKSLAPLRKALLAAMARRSPFCWQEQPRVRTALGALALADLVEPAPRPLLVPTETLAAVMERFKSDDASFFYVSSDGLRLDGLVTMTDLLRVKATAAPSGTPLAKFMTKDPRFLTLADSCLVASDAFRDCGYERLPVVRDAASRQLEGFVRARRLLARILQVVGPAEGHADSDGLR